MSSGLWEDRHGASVVPNRGSLEPGRRSPPGDSIMLELPMRPEVMVANPRVTEARDSVVLKRGPLIYCVGSVDNSGLSFRDAGLRVGGGGRHLREVAHTGSVVGAIAIIGDGSVPAEP